MPPGGIETTLEVPFTAVVFLPAKLQSQMKKLPQIFARRWFVHGRVQGVGFRWFVVRCARQLAVTGWARNEDDGAVQVYALGTEEQLDSLAGFLHQGPALSDVRSVEQAEASLEKHRSFEIR